MPLAPNTRIASVSISAESPQKNLADSLRRQHGQFNSYFTLT
jgi:hypothetical protein